MLTDYVLACLAVAFAWNLRRRDGTGNPLALRLWRIALGTTALAAILGGTAHGFRLYLGEDLHAIIWALTVLTIALSVLLTLAAAIRSVLHPAIAPGIRRAQAHRWLKRGLYLTLVGVAIQQSGWVFHEHFNHNDLYHLIQMPGLYCLYRGALILEGLTSA